MRKLLLCLLFVGYATGILAQSFVSKLESAYNNFSVDPQLRYGLSSLTVLNARTGEVVFAKGEAIGLAPASTLKTITSITAFRMLGDNFTWETLLGYTGSLSDGILNGDLILCGNGDPTLGSSRYDQSRADVLLNRWLSAIKKAGIRGINGRIVADDRLFGTQSLPQGWVWQDIGNYYGAGASALNWRENEFALSIKPGSRVGDPVSLTVSGMEGKYLRMVNEVTTGKVGSGDNVYAYSAPYTDLIYVRGTYGIDLKKTIMASLPDAAYHLALEVRNKLVASSVEVSGEATTTRRINMAGQGFYPVSTILDRYRSPTLSRVVYWLNQKSLNLYAENILRTLAVKQGKEGSTTDGVSVLKEFWNARLQVDPGSVDILDGSGLSPENRITTLTMARILLDAKNEPWFDSFYESLPVYNDMKMKSGSISKVLAYAGYQTSANGTPLVFSFIVNHFNGPTSSIREKMFSVLDVLK